MGAESAKEPDRQAGYCRFPAIWGDQIIFCSEADLWTASPFCSPAPGCRHSAATSCFLSLPAVAWSALLLEKLLRKRIGYGVPRRGLPEPYPTESIAGPIVAITTQFSGSDGDIFSHAFKQYKLGPLIGKRTWGGVIGNSGRRRLVDGTLTTQPEFAFWFSDVGWNLENYGVDPDEIKLPQFEMRPAKTLTD